MNVLSQTYHNDSVLSLPPGQLLLRLYDCALMRLQQAEEMLRAGNQPEASRALSKGLAIVSHLRENLRLDTEAEAAPLLDELYGVVSHWLLDANLNQDAVPIQNSRRVLSTLKEGWDGAVQELA
jgi:flagellar protein FliS